MSVTYAGLTAVGGTVITAVYGNMVRDSSIIPFTDAATRDATILVPTEGQVCYLRDYDDLWGYSGAAWKWYAGTSRAYKSGDETVNNSSALQNDDHLSIPVAAGAVYYGELAFMFTSQAAAGLKTDFTAPAGATMENAAFLTRVSGTTVYDPTSTLGAVSGLTGTGAKIPVFIPFTLFTVSSGTLQFRWAQNTANASNSIVHKGSSLILTRAS